MALTIATSQFSSVFPRRLFFFGVSSSWSIMQHLPEINSSRETPYKVLFPMLYFSVVAEADYEYGRG
ncbi:hypothetical protein DU478_21580 [Thalassococcus profundi]|uniref:Uncharacterized protein n=1 Tax=Thalassococcus profundi TaxID=2282382 RepID=A0A369TFP6_9RHOB|nr:hypothetical protein DU478_21580 [Thalassococcus profundi]